MARLLIIFSLLYAFHYTIAKESNISDYQLEVSKLEKRLFTDYDSKTPPSPQGAGKPVVVNLQLHCTHLAVPKGDVATLKFHGTLFYRWVDDRLGWNPADESGQKRILLSSFWKIWRPTIVQQMSGIHKVLQPSKTPKVTAVLHVDDANHFQKAAVDFLHEVEFAIPCQVSGKYPRERLECSFFLYSYHPSKGVVFDEQEGYVLFSQFTESIDWDPVEFGEWSLESSSQKLMGYEIKSAELFEKSTTTAYQRSALVVKLTINRSSASRALLTFVPILIVNLILICGWIFPQPYSTWMSASTVIMLSTVIRDVQSTIPLYDNKLNGIALTIVFLWVSTFMSLITHQILNLARVRRESVRLLPILERMPLFTRLETQLLNRPDRDTKQLQLPPAQIVYPLLIIAILHLLIVPILLF